MPSSKLPANTIRIKAGGRSWGAPPVGGSRASSGETLGAGGETPGASGDARGQRRSARRRDKPAARGSCLRQWRPDLVAHMNPMASNLATAVQVAADSAVASSAWPAVAPPAIATIKMSRVMPANILYMKISIICMLQHIQKLIHTWIMVAQKGK